MTLGLAAVSSCIDNDIPYPRIQPNFTRFEVAGQYQDADIDTVNRAVVVYLPEDADLSNVNITSYAISPADATVAGDVLAGAIDLSTTLDVTLSLYQDYLWTITAVQPIERYFTISGQIGSSVIDAAAHRVVATVPVTFDLSAITVESIKLGPDGSTMSPDLAGQTVDFTSPVTVDVTTHGVTTPWTIYIETATANVTTVSADAWTCVAWVSGAAQAGKDNGVEYRRAGAESWTKVPTDWITFDGGSFTARIIHLDPATSYQARAYSDGEYGATLDFTTGVEQQVPNTTLSEWWLDGKVWCPWAEGGESYWDTGNKGATTLGQSNSVPTDDTSSPSIARAAMLQTKFVGVSTLGKLAAGNLFTGVYVRTDGTNGVLSFGREFSQRPTRLRGYMKYHSATISNSISEMAHLKGQPDTCIVWMALSDAAQPYEIRTNNDPKKRQLFDPDDPSVIAYGKFQTGSDVNDYTQFEVQLDYRSTSRVPRYIVIVCSASKYGDYFTGGNGSVLYVDDLQLLYDY